MDKDLLQEYKRVLLDMMTIITKICDENGIKYFMLGGTFIGAIRHNGFIPWDDDIDIAMFRQDYEKFLKIISEKLPDNLKLYHYSNNKNVVEHFIKIINSDYMIIENMGENGDVKVKNNAFIDILPFDSIPDNKIDRCIYKIQMTLKLIKMKILSLSVTYKSGYDGKNIIKKCFIAYLKNKKINYADELKKYDMLSKKYQNKVNSEVVTNFSSRVYKTIYEKETFSRKDIEELKKYKFENIELYGIKNYDYFLKKRFGNYMKLPPKEEQVSKHLDKIIKLGDK